MGREVKRVPIDFSWRLNKVWFGYVLPSITCELCYGKNNECKLCWGDGVIFPKIQVPEGDGYQMWETCSEGSPISPVFDTPEKLAKWLADNNASAFGSQTASYDEWLGMIHRKWAPSAIMTIESNGSKQIISGVAAIGKELRNKNDNN